MKKFIAFILSLVIIVSCTSTAFATPQSNIDVPPTEASNKGVYIYSLECPEEYINFATEKIADFLETSEFVGLTPCYLGTPFTFANTDSNIFYFPIYHLGEIICLLRVYSDSRGNIAGVLSKGFSEALNTIADFTSAVNPLKIIFDGTNIIFQTAQIKQTVFSYPNNKSEYAKTRNNELLVEGTVKKCSEEGSLTITLPQATVLGTNNSTYLDIFESNGRPLETQGGEYWCAAFAASAIMRYKGITGLCAEDIMAYYYDDPEPTDSLSDEHIYSYATVLGFNTALVNSTLSFARLCNEINYDRPVYLVMHSESNGVHDYHAVVLCGYNSTTAMVRIWNPWYDYYETIYSLSNYVPAENSSYTFEYAETIYNWVRHLK